MINYDNTQLHVDGTLYM